MFTVLQATSIPACWSAPDDGFGEAVVDVSSEE
jgi:hypothetical protein